MDALPAATRTAFCADLVAGFEANRARVTPRVRTGKDNTWLLWTTFCRAHQQDPFLSSYPGDPLDFFVVFGLRYRRGDIAKDSRGRPTTGGKGVRSAQVATALQAVGERFAELDGKDPRLPHGDKLAPRIKGLLKFFDNEDPPASRIWPVCLTILRQLEVTLRSEPPERAGAILDLCILAFFFLCRPGEYALSTKTDVGRSSPFRLQDIHFSTPDRHRANAATCPLHDVKDSDFVSLTYTDQKNAVRGETIGHHTNKNSIFNPVAALRRRVLHLRANNAPPDTPVHTYYPPDGAPLNITTTAITLHLRKAAKAVQHITGIPPERIHSYSLRSGGATALLCANAGTHIISLIGRWKSDAMFRYLRTQAKELMLDYSSAMLQHGSYTFAPSAEDLDRDLVPKEAPAAVWDAVAPLPDLDSDEPPVRAPL